MLIPSIVTDSCEEFPPATERLPLASVCTPGCVVSVDIALVEPAARVAIATGKSTSSRPVFVSPMFDVSVWIFGDIRRLDVTACAWVPIFSVASRRLDSRASRSNWEKSSFWNPVASIAKRYEPISTPETDSHRCLSVVAVRLYWSLDS